MNENVENLILVQLQNIRSRLDGMDSRLDAMASQIEALGTQLGEGFDDVNGRVDGNTMMVRSLALSVHMVDTRVDTLEERLK